MRFHLQSSASSDLSAPGDYETYDDGHAPVNEEAITVKVARSPQLSEVSTVACFSDRNAWVGMLDASDMLDSQRRLTFFTEKASAMVQNCHVRHLLASSKLLRFILASAKQM